MSGMEYETETRGYDDEGRGYDRDRSRSPRPDRRDDDGGRARSASPNGRERMDDRPPPQTEEEEEAARNPGSNLFVTGIHPRLSEDEVAKLFGKYGDVDKCNIMRDPHTKESRGFGFVKMMTPEQADAAKEGLQGEVIEGRTLSIEKARRAKPRTPTPGKYFGPPKRTDDFRGGRPRGGGGRYGSDRYSDRYDDRRGYGGRDDSYGGGGYRSSRYDDRYDDRGYGGRREPRDDYGPPRGVDRYASRDDRYGSSRGGGDYDRRGGGGGGRRYEREERGGGYGGGAPPPMDDSYGGSRSYDDRGDYGYSRR